MPQESDLNKNTQIRIRIQPRPPIRNKSLIATPAPSVPSTPKTPSRLPIAIRAPKTAKAMASNQTTTNVMNPLEPSIGDVSTSNAPNAEAGRTVIVFPAPTAQPTQPSVLLSPTPIPNMTINFNVNNSTSQSPKQTPQITRVIEKPVEKLANATDGGDGSKPDSSADSMMTNDEDSEENARSSVSTLGTPTGSVKDDAGNNISVRRQLFPTNSKRRSETFNKIDDLTRSIVHGDSISSPNNSGFQTRSKNTNQTNRNESDAATRKSQTFTKPKASIQNATFDVHAENGSSSTRHRGKNKTQEDESAISEQNYTESINNMANLPSEALLDPIDVSDDENDAEPPTTNATIDAHIPNGVNNRNSADSNMSSKSSNEPIATRRSKRHNNKSVQSQLVSEGSSKTITDPKLTDMHPRVDLSQIQNANPNATNTSKIRESCAYELPPPIQFENADKSLIVEDSPVSSQNRFAEVSHVYSVCTKVILFCFFLPK